MKKMKKILLLSLIVSLLLGCEEPPLTEQGKFQKEIYSYIDEYNKFEGNDITQDNICKKLDDFIKGKKCSNWEGTVVKVNSFLGIERWVTVESGGISFMLWPEKDEDWSRIGEQKLNNLIEGDIITFSGTVIREMSITCSGKMREPEIKVEPDFLSTK
jgi:hypothetical protein